MLQTRVVRIVLAVLALVLFASCGQGGWMMGGDESERSSGGGAATTSQDQAGAPPQAEPAQQAPLDGTDRLIVRAQVLRLEVQSTPDAVDEVRRLAGEHSATITNMQVATDDDWLYRYDQQGGAPAGDGTALRGWVTVRVPADDLTAFVADVSELGTVVYQSESTDDVTQEHIDLTARLENLRAQEARLRELVAAANNVEEMLAVEQELWRIRGEIESLDAQVQYLERQAALATVTVELTEEQPVVRPGGRSWGFLDAITDGIQGAAGVLAFLVTFLIASAPLWLIGLLVFYLVRRARRRRAANRVTATTPPAGAKTQQPPTPVPAGSQPAGTGRTEPSPAEPSPTEPSPAEPRPAGEAPTDVQAAEPPNPEQPSADR